MAKKRPYNWAQFSFRTLLLLLTLMCIWLAHRANRARQQARGRQVFHASGGAAELALEPRLPWIDEWFGEDFVHEIGNVALPKDVDDEWLAQLKLVRTAHSLSVIDRSVTGTGFEHLRHLRNLSALTLDSLPELQTEAFAHLRSLTKLEDLTVSACPAMTDVAAAQLANLGNLQSLVLDDCPITDQGLQHLRKLKKLRVLSLARTKITAAGLAHIAELQNLEELTLSGTAITDEGLPHLKQMKTLKFLNLNNTKVTALEALRLQAQRPDLELFFGAGTPLDPVAVP